MDPSVAVRPLVGVWHWRIRVVDFDAKVQPQVNPSVLVCLRHPLFCWHRVSSNDEVDIVSSECRTVDEYDLSCIVSIAHFCYTDPVRCRLGRKLDHVLDPTTAGQDCTASS